MPVPRWPPSPSPPSPPSRAATSIGSSRWRGRTSSVPGGDDDPIVQVARGAIAGVVAEMSGDPEGAVAAFATAPLDAVPAALALSPQRFLMHCLLLGRSRRRRRPRRRRGAGDDRQPPLATGSGVRPLAGRRPQRLRATRPTAGRPRARRQRSRRVRRRRVPRRDPRQLGRAVAVPGHRRRQRPRRGGRRQRPCRPCRARPRRSRRPRSRSAMSPPASPTIRSAIATSAASSPSATCSIRRRRAAWDAAPLGPAHERARTVARALARAARRPTRSPSTPRRWRRRYVFTVLPLPWSVELACRLHGNGSSLGAALAGYLLERAGLPRPPRAALGGRR